MPLSTTQIETIEAYYASHLKDLPEGQEKSELIIIAKEHIHSAKMTVDPGFDPKVTCPICYIPYLCGEDESYNEEPMHTKCRDGVVHTIGKECFEEIKRIAHANEYPHAPNCPVCRSPQEEHAPVNDRGASRKRVAELAEPELSVEDNEEYTTGLAMFLAGINRLRSAPTRYTGPHEVEINGFVDVSVAIDDLMDAVVANTIATVENQDWIRAWEAARNL